MENLMISRLIWVRKIISSAASFSLNSSKIQSILLFPKDILRSFLMRLIK